MIGKTRNSCRRVFKSARAEQVAVLQANSGRVGARNGAGSSSTASTSSNFVVSDFQVLDSISPKAGKNTGMSTSPTQMQQANWVTRMKTFVFDFTRILFFTKNRALKNRPCVYRAVLVDSHDAKMRFPIKLLVDTDVATGAERVVIKSTR